MQNNDERIRIRQSKQTVRVTVTITHGQREKLDAAVKSSGFNASELVRYALIQFFRKGGVFLPADYISDKQV
ncbi:MAG: hypothetical protein J7K94_03535 [Dehalococcoidia bacterium]|nr:hypothetical protein [Dehalococcoidia bacterium]